MSLSRAFAYLTVNGGHRDSLKAQPKTYSCHFLLFTMLIHEQLMQHIGKCYEQSGKCQINLTVMKIQRKIEFFQSIIT